jgi:predicted Rossmann-fold nucleotide-binding protein
MSHLNEINEFSEFHERSLECGPILNIPAYYQPYCGLTEEEFQSLYGKSKNGEKLSFKEQFLVRDYVLWTIKTSYRNRDFDEFCNLKEFIFHYSKEELEAFFWGLNFCSCCWRHAHNVPEDIFSNKMRNMLEVATQGMIDEDKDKCFSYTRTYKRLIKAAYDAKVAAETEK